MQDQKRHGNTGHNRCNCAFPALVRTHNRRQFVFADVLAHVVGRYIARPNRKQEKHDERCI